MLPVAIVAIIVIVGVLAFQRGREGFDLTGNNLLRAYLYLGLLAGVLAIAFGFSALLNAALATPVGNELVYGGVPAFPPFPVGVDCPHPSVQIPVPAVEAVEQRRLEDIVRG